MPPEAIGSPATLYLCRDRVRIIAGRFSADHERQFQRDANSMLPEHRAQRVGRRVRERARRYLHRQYPIAERDWPEQDVIGKRLKYGPPQIERAWLTIVGVVADVKHGALDTETLPGIYQPYAQAEDRRILGLGRSISFAIRPEGDFPGLPASLRKTVWSLDDQLAVLDLQTMTEAVDRTMAPRRFNMLLLGVFAGVALILACIGTYGLVSYSVAQRTREIALRIALGAQRRDVFSLVIRQSMTLVAGCKAAHACAPVGGSVLRRTHEHTLRRPARAVGHGQSGGCGGKGLEAGLGSVVRPSIRNGAR